MACSGDHSTNPWAIARAQHGVITHEQLSELGFSRRAINHRLGTGRLHAARWRGVYAVGRPELSRRGEWMAAILTVDADGLSNGSAGALCGMLPDDRTAPIEVIGERRRRQPGIVTHRGEREMTRCHGIPVTSPTDTLVDLAASLDARALEAAVNEADKRDLIDPERLRNALDTMTRRPGVARLRKLLDRRTFTLTDSELERRFKPLARAAGLPKPLTRVHVNGFRVDFYWPELGLVVETDGLKYHRTPAQQARDRLRDQTHTAAGLTQLRFTHAQIAFDRDHVRKTLAAVRARLRTPGSLPWAPASARRARPA
jgi:very-short-patch-repair endonuclease